MVKAPAAKVLPEGYELAADFAGLPDPGAKVKGKLKAVGSRLKARVQCPGRFAACNDGTVVVKARGAGKFKVAKGTFEAEGGQRKTVKMKLTNRARQYFREHRKLKVTAKVKTAERIGAWKRNRKAVAR